jgi:hypothetical protein
MKGVSLFMDRETIRFIKGLKDYRGLLPRQVIKTLRGQALAGDMKGAKKGLKKEVGKFGRVIPTFKKA